jgi:2-polyprenyl-3-methyl-5-hydroxy-6-metoxy-1,4-benzoquinol methylase
MTFYYDELSNQIVEQWLDEKGNNQEQRINAKKIVFKNKSIYVAGYPLFYPLSREDWEFNEKFSDWEYECDQSDLFCPAWIRLKNQPENMSLGEGVSVFIDNVRILYRDIMGSLFIPWSQYNSIGCEDNWKSIEDSIEFKEIYWNKLSELYDRAYNKSNLKNSPYIDEIEKFLHKNKIGKKASILSIGAGTGIVEEELAKRGFKNITLVDQSERMLDTARRKEYLKNCNFVCARAEDYSPQEGFDIIIAFKTFCWVETKDILRICVNNLKKKGYYITDNEIDYYFKKNHNMKPLYKVLRHGTSSKLFKKSGKQLYVYN